ncbi:hypothetical protein AVEN_118634-1 [Araneus ventricosus]|uniref:Uncharacterized protein n=1 Tax=Araneus ventricosus TaxID=182803 RepID=A0A4Y2AWK7_ARAVE|nr:hypothetical protein AVEN_118634-1 [Araneus ventricosus]
MFDHFILLVDFKRSYSLEGIKEETHNLPDAIILQIALSLQIKEETHYLPDAIILQIALSLQIKEETHYLPDAIILQIALSQSRRSLT